MILTFNSFINLHTLDACIKTAVIKEWYAATLDLSHNMNDVFGKIYKHIECVTLQAYRMCNTGITCDDIVY